MSAIPEKWTDKEQDQYGDWHDVTRRINPEWADYMEVLVKEFAEAIVDNHALSCLVLKARKVMGRK